MKQQSFPTLQEMAANLAVDLGSIEVVKWELYDFNIYPTAGVTQLGFFLTGQGQGQSASTGAAAGAVKSLADTNLTGAGVLPAPQAFWTEEIEITTIAGSTATANTFVIQPPANSAAANAATVQAGAHDCNAILSTGALDFRVSQKPYYQTAPLFRAPPKKRMQMDVALASTSATQTELVKELLYATGDPLKLDPGVGIMTAQNFTVNLVWPVVVATPSGFNAKIGVTLGGWLFRGVQ